MLQSLSHLNARKAVAVVSLVAAFVIASYPARAVPVDVFFDGPTSGGTNFGLSQTQALNLQSSFGVPIVDTFDYVGTALGVVDVTQDLQSFTPSPPVSNDIQAVSNWDVENVSGSNLLGATYLMFTSTTPFTKNGVIVDYVDSNVGLQIDADLGWALVKTTSGGQDFYYPSIVLDRSVPNPLGGSYLDGDIESIVVNYQVNQALLDAPAGSGDYQLPLLNVGIAFAAVPEPGTGLLVSIGLIGLSLRRRCT